MSAISMIFNRNALKLVAALAIPSSIAYFFYFSQQQANRELEQYKKEQATHATSEELVVNDYEMKEVDDSNRLRWLLKSHEGKLMPNGQDVELKGVKVEYYDPTTKALKMSITAPLGVANQTTKYVKLNADKTGRVIADGNPDPGFTPPPRRCRAGSRCPPGLRT